MSKVKNYSIGLILLTLISKIMGFVREIVISYFYGASEVGDAYSIVNSLVILVVIGVASSVMTAYIPVVSGQNEEQQNNVTFKLLRVLSCFTILLTIVTIVLAEPIIKYLCKGFSDANHQFAVVLLKIVSLSFLCIVCMYLLIGYINVKGSYYINGIQLILTNTVAIISIAISGVNAFKLGMGYVASYLVPFVICGILAYKSGLSGHFRNKTCTNDLSFVFAVIVAFVGINIIKLNVMIDRISASMLQEGAVSSLNYGYTLVAVVPEVVIFSLITVYYPKLSELFVNNSKKKFADTVTFLLEICILVLIPCSLIFWVYSSDIIDILLNRGAFDAGAFAMTEQAIKGYTIGMLPIGMNFVLCKVFFSRKQYMWPAIAMVISWLVNLLLNRLGKDVLQLSIATTISVSVSMFIMIAGVLKERLAINWKKIGLCVLRTIAGTSIMALIMFGLSFLVKGRPLFTFMKLVYIAISVGIALTAGGIVMYVTGEPILKEGIRLLRSRMKKKNGVN